VPRGEGTEDEPQHGQRGGKDGTIFHGLLTVDGNRKAKKVASEISTGTASVLVFLEDIETA
jgi:hypothetical protein